VSTRGAVLTIAVSRNFYLRWKVQAAPAQHRRNQIRLRFWNDSKGSVRLQLHGQGAERPHPCSEGWTATLLAYRWIWVVGQINRLRKVISALVPTQGRAGEAPA
jgi:hypothetical protein